MSNYRWTKAELAALRGEGHNPLVDRYEHLQMIKKARAKIKRQSTEERIVARRGGLPAWAAIDDDQLALAIQHMGIRGRVYIRRSNGLNTRGCAYYRNGQHHITLSKHMHAEQATITLLHELTHAQQREEHGESFWEEYKRENRVVGYTRNRFELEARENADLLAQLFDIVN